MNGTPQIPEKPSRSFFRGIRGRLWGLILILLLPVLAAQGLILRDRHENRLQSELQKELEAARSAAQTFDVFIQAMSRQAQALGAAAALPEMAPERIQALLDGVALEYRGMCDFTLMGTGGAIIASSLPETMQPGPDTPFQAAASGGLRMGGLSEPGGGFPTITLSRSVTGEGGDLQGFVIATVSMHLLKEIFAPKVSGDAALTIFDQSGRAVFRLPETAWTAEKRDALKHDPVLAKALGGVESVSVPASPFDGEKTFAAFAPISSIGWAAGFSRPEKEVTTPIYRDLYREAGVMVAVCIGAVLLSMTFLRSVAGPAGELRNRVYTLAKGRKSQPIRVEGPVEVREIADAFNLMAGEIHIRESERYHYLFQMRRLLELSSLAAGEDSTEELIKKATEAARKIAGAEAAIYGGFLPGGIFRTDFISGADAAPPFVPGEELSDQESAACFEIVRTGKPFRLTEAELQKRGLDCGIEGCDSLGGLVGAGISGRDGALRGVILVSGKKSGDFTPEDEALIAAIAAVASLGLQLVEARVKAETSGA